MPETVGHPTSYAYPTFAQLQEVLPTLLARLRGEPVATNDLAQSAYVALGFGLSVTLPHEGVHAMEADPTTAQLRDASATIAAAIPWDVLLPLIMPIIMDFLKRWINR